jgi:hypothetical protein
MVFLWDEARLPESAVITDEGYLEVTGNLARVGVMPYGGKELGRSPDRVYQVYRSAQVVKDTAEQLKNKPVTVGHPPDGVSLANAEKEWSGSVVDAWFDEATGWVKGKMLLTHPKAIKAYFDGYKEISVGAKNAELVDSSGQWLDEVGVQEKGKAFNYDLEIANLKGNHVALVKRARAGSKATFDSAEQNEDIIINIDNGNVIKELTMEKKFSISLHDGSSVDLSGDNAKDIFKTFESLTKEKAELTSQVVKLQDSVSDYEGLQSQVTELTKKLDIVTGELEAKKVQLADAQSATVEADERKSWLQTYSEVKPMLADGGDEVFALSVADLKRSAVKAVKGIDLADKTDDYVTAFYAGLLESGALNQSSNSRAKTILDNTQDGDARSKLEAAFAERNKQVEANALGFLGGK